MQGIRPGAEVVATGRALMAPVGEGLLGRVLDGLGRPIDGKGPLPPGMRFEPVEGRPPSPLDRPPIERRLALGVRALDAVIPCGRGQRLGIFAGSGVGKSTLLGMIARNTAAAVNVIGLIGERGREVREFIERDLGPEGLARSVIVCATSDEPPLVRVTAAFLAMRIAESFRDRGDDVLLMMDSVTRFAMAQREIGLAIGEPPATRGYTPSVFALLPRLLERAGTSRDGSITALTTVLVEGDDMNEPIADAVRGIIDGHVVLTRELAHRNHYPAIDVLAQHLAGRAGDPERAGAGGGGAAARGARDLPLPRGPDRDRRLPAGLGCAYRLRDRTHPCPRCVPPTASGPPGAGGDRREPARGDAGRLLRRVRGGRVIVAVLKPVPLSVDISTAPRMAAPVAGAAFLLPSHGQGSP